jgi:FkbM family methyltransferase
MAYLNAQLVPHIQGPVKTILELGSRDLEDAVRLVEHFGAHVYAFECNPDCLELCYKKQAELPPAITEKLTLVPYAVSVTDGPVTFYSFDREKYDNMGASSMLKIDFTKRNKSDPDYGRPNPQKAVTVPGLRMDTFCEAHRITPIDLLCMDLQGYELEALKSFGSLLTSVKYIITEVGFKSTYEGGVEFETLRRFLSSNGFTFKGHDAGYPELANYLDTLLPGAVEKTFLHDNIGFSEFNCIFQNENTQTPATGVDVDDLILRLKQKMAEEDRRRALKAQIVSHRKQIAKLTEELAQYVSEFEEV